VDYRMVFAKHASPWQIHMVVLEEVSKILKFGVLYQFLSDLFRGI
jgi:hypothetical protein